MKQGWAKLPNSQKWHYFQDGRSLCGVWVYFGEFHKEEQTTRATGQADCPKCLNLKTRKQ